MDYYHVMEKGSSNYIMEEMGYKYVSEKGTSTVMDNWTIILPREKDNLSHPKKYHYSTVEKGVKQTSTWKSTVIMPRE